MEKHDALIQEFFDRHPDLQVCAGDMRRAFSFISDCYREGGKLLLCGNGGSAADCEHIAGELMKGFLSSRTLSPEHQRLLAAQSEDGAYLAQHLQEALPCLSLTSHPSLNSAFANDVDPALCFAQQVYGYGKRGDVLLAISTSGNAKNVCYAATCARAMGIKTIGLTGKTGGKLQEICHLTVRAPYEETYRVQEAHECMYHLLCAALEARFFG
ncbi:MAG TPA: SIS domain-containing protein [Candidatus Gallacutalibacter stercoravium]|nr:SIS domain-containing protein [Candidatus Gallacutalibacter stercoravium]